LPALITLKACNKPILILFISVTQPIIRLLIRVIEKRKTNYLRANNFYFKKKLIKTNIKKGLDGFKDLGRLLKRVFFIIFCITIYNKKFIIICKVLINLKANNYLFVNKLFI